MHIGVFNVCQSCVSGISSYSWVQWRDLGGARFASTELLADSVSLKGWKHALDNILTKELTRYLVESLDHVTKVFS